MANKNNYFYIRNYSSNGEMAIAKHAIEEIALLAISKIKGLAPHKENPKSRNFANYNPISCNISKDNKVSIQVDVDVKKNVNVKDVCLKAQDEIKNAFLLSCEFIPSNINIKVAGIED